MWQHDRTSHGIFLLVGRASMTPEERLVNEPEKQRQAGLPVPEAFNREPTAEVD